MASRIRTTHEGLEIRAFGWPPTYVYWDVVVIPLTLTFPLWIGFTTRGMLTAAIVAPACVLSILAHELGHAFAARRFGMEVVRIELYMTGGHVEFVGERWSLRADRLITLAGPAVNVAIGLACLALFHTLTSAPEAAYSELSPIPFTTPPPFHIRALQWIGWINIVLAATNLLPAYPLDGGKLADSFIAPRWGRDVALFWVGALGVAFGALSLLATFALLLGGMLLRCPPEITANLEAIRASAWRPWKRSARPPAAPVAAARPRGADVPDWLKRPNAPAGPTKTSPKTIAGTSGETPARPSESKVTPLKTWRMPPPANLP